MNEVIDKLCEKFGVVVDKTQPYMEDLISRVCKYEIATSFVWIIISILMIVLAIFIIKHAFVEEFIVFAVVITLIAVAIAICQSMDIISAIYLPEKTVIDMISSYTQGGV